MAEDEEREVGKLVDEFKDKADELEQRSRKLGEQIEDVREDWEHKRRDEGVPGAVPPEGEDSSESSQT